MPDYYNKYIKYKNKYLNLLKDNKPLIGGLEKKEIKAKLDVIKAKYMQDYIPFTYCEKRGFKQHNGECWNDSIQTLFCFSDELKNQVQGRLFNLSAEDIVELAFLKERDKYLPYFYKNNEANLQRMKDKLIIYIKLLQQRLCIYAHDYQSINENEKVEIIPKSCLTNFTCPVTDPIKTLVEPPSSNNLKEQPPFVKPLFLRTDTKKIGIDVAIIGKEISRNIDFIRKSNIENEKDHGGNLIEYLILINLLSFVFVNDPYVLIIKTIFISQPDYFDITNETVFIEIDSVGEKGAHSTGFFKCNNKLFYYDDNRGIIEFNFIKYLEFYINYQSYDPVINISILMTPFFINIKNNKYYKLLDDEKLKEFDVGKNEIFKVTKFNIINKIKVNDQIDYINKNAINLLEIELFNKTYQNIKKYIESGLDINLKYTDNQSNILQYIIAKGCNDIELIEYLIEEKKIDVNYKDVHGYNLIIYIKENTKQIYEYLINKGVDIKFKINIAEMNILQFIIVNGSDDIELIKYLIEDIKIDVNYIDKYGNTSLSYLKVKDKKTFEYLVNKSSNLNHFNNNNDSTLNFLLLNMKDNLELAIYICTTFEKKLTKIDIIKIINTPNKKNEYLINELAKKNYINIFKYLVERYAIDTRVKDSFKYSPIHYAISKKSNEVFNYILKNNINDPNFLRILTSDGNTLIHFAVFNNNLHAIEKLFEMSDRLYLDIEKTRNREKKLPYEVINDGNGLARYLAHLKYCLYMIKKEKDPEKKQKLIEYKYELRSLYVDNKI